MTSSPIPFEDQPLPPTQRRAPFFGLGPVARKEFTHILRDPTTLFFALLIPLIQLFLFGYAVDTNVRQIPTVIFDESHTQQSRSLIQSFAASDIFRISAYVQTEADLYSTMRSGKARVAIRIPYDYARSLQRGTTASVLVLVDGSDSSVAGIAVDASTGVALEQSLAPHSRPPLTRNRGPPVGPLQPQHPLRQLLHPRPHRHPSPGHDHPSHRSLTRP